MNARNDWGGAIPAVPFDLPRLRLWIDGLAADYAVVASTRDAGPRRRTTREAKSHAADLDALRRDFSRRAGAAKPDDVLRRLLATGVAQYVSAATGLPPAGAMPEHVLLDVVAFALWPVVQAPVLPSGWEGALAQLTTPRMANLVSRVRSAGAGRKPADFVPFARLLGARPVSQGALNLLRDLADPRGGGAVLTALALAGGLPVPGKRRDAKGALIWVFTSVLGGALSAEGGNTVPAIDRFVEEAWDWMVGDAPSPGGDGTGLIDELIHGLFH